MNHFYTNDYILIDVKEILNIYYYPYDILDYVIFPRAYDL